MFEDVTNVSMLERFRVFIPKGWANISQSKLAAIRFTKKAFSFLKTLLIEHCSL